MNDNHIKHCRNKRAFATELMVYQSAFPYKADLISTQTGNTLILSRLTGIPYLDVQKMSRELLINLALTISQLHAVQQEGSKVWCHWDNQPRNILWNEEQQQIYLLDFEDCRLAAPEADIAHLFLFWAEVMNHQDFISNTAIFLQAYTGKVPLQSYRWSSEACKARQRFDTRRRKYNKQEPFINPDKKLNRTYLSRFLF